MHNLSFFKTFENSITAIFHSLHFHSLHLLNPPTPIFPGPPQGLESPASSPLAVGGPARLRTQGSLGYLIGGYGCRFLWKSGDPSRRGAPPGRFRSGRQTIFFLGRGTPLPPGEDTPNPFCVGTPWLEKKPVWLTLPAPSPSSIPPKSGKHESGFFFVIHQMCVRGVLHPVLVFSRCPIL